MADISNYDQKGRCLKETNIYNPMKHILGQKNESGMRRQIFLLTDGAVTNTDQIINLIEEKAFETNSRVHTFGVGSESSRQLIKGAALAGFGSHAFIN